MRAERGLRSGEARPPEPGRAAGSSGCGRSLHGNGDAPRARGNAARGEGRRGGWMALAVSQALFLPPASRWGGGSALPGTEPSDTQGAPSLLFPLSGRLTLLPSPGPEGPCKMSGIYGEMDRSTFSRGSSYGAPQGSVLFSSVSLTPAQGSYLPTALKFTSPALISP